MTAKWQLVVKSTRQALEPSRWGAGDVRELCCATNLYVCTYVYESMYRGPGGDSEKRVRIKGPSVNRTIFVVLHLILQYGMVHNDITFSIFN